MNPEPGEVDFEAIRSYFGGKLAAHGDTPQGVDWNSPRAQELRFEQLIKVCAPHSAFSILDYGCGYGALIPYIERLGFQADYSGFDLVESMVEQARKTYADRPNCRFTARPDELAPVDYSVASGIFNKHFEAGERAWQDYIVSTLQQLDRLSRKGFAFNMLTGYSDRERMRPDLYYADPLWVFDLCKRQFARNVALLHDYEIYDFTILVRKPAHFEAL